MSDAARSRLAVATFAVTVSMLAAAGAFRLVHDGYGDAYAPVFYVVWAVVGFVLAARRPRNAIGWLFLTAAACWAASGLAGHYAMYGLRTVPGSLPAPVFAYWVMTWVWLPGLVLLPTFALLLFPDGRLPSPRWRWAARAAGLGIGLAMLAYTLAPWQGNDEFGWVPAGVENPLRGTGLGALHDPLLAVALPLVLAASVAGAVALVVRYRRARTGERQQLKWAVFGGIASVTIYLTGDVTTRLPGIEWWLVTLLAAVLFPVTILTAVLRYRLYDIDRMVSRTVAYGLVTVALIGLYVVGVVGLGALVRGITGVDASDAVVAASTLLVAAAFGPLRRRAQTAIDRRFNRARYDASRVIEAFAQRLRDEVDLALLAGDIRDATMQAVQPSHATVWLRDPDARRA